MTILEYVLALGGIDALVGLHGLIDENPDAHPHEAQHTDDHKGHLPSVAHAHILEVACQGGDAQGRDEGADGGSGIEDGGGEGAVFLGEIFGGDLDSGGEVAALTGSKHHAGSQEEPHADHRHRGCHVAGSAHELGCIVETYPLLGGPATQGVETGTGRPHADSPKVAATGAQPVDDATGEEIGDGIHDGEGGGYVAIVGIGPMKLGSDEVFPREREGLAVQIIDSGSEEEHRANYPTEVGLSGSLNIIHVLR